MLPNSERAFIDPSKVRDYLLSSTMLLAVSKPMCFRRSATLKKIGNGFAMTCCASRRPESHLPANPVHSGKSLKLVIISLGLPAAVVNS